MRPADASLRTSGYVLDVSVDGFLQFLGALENPVPRASSNLSAGLRSLPVARPEAQYAPVWSSNTRRWRTGGVEVKFHRREARQPTTAFFFTASPTARVHARTSLTTVDLQLRRYASAWALSFPFKLRDSHAARPCPSHI